MTTQSIDTNPEVEKHLIFLLRNSSVAKRISQTQHLTKTMLQLSRRAISRANPKLSAEELDILFVKYHYGDELANKLRVSLGRNQI
jgi:hypothetical protein